MDQNETTPAPQAAHRGQTIVQPPATRRVSVVYIWVRSFPKLQSYASGKLSRPFAWGSRMTERSDGA